MVPANVPLFRTKAEIFDDLVLDAVEGLERQFATELAGVEFAVEDGIPYAIDFMNPAPDADLHSVGQANFDWIVKEVADLAIAKAKAAPQMLELNWASFLKGAPSAPKTAEKTAAKKAPAKKKAAKKAAAKKAEAKVTSKPNRSETKPEAENAVLLK